MLRTLADADEHDLVKQVQEFYGDFIAVNEDLFTLNIANSLQLSGPTASPETSALFTQSVQGILSMLLSMKAEPCQIRFQGTSPVRIFETFYLVSMKLFQSRLIFAANSDRKARGRRSTANYLIGRSFPFHSSRRPHAAYSGPYGRPSDASPFPMDIPGHGSRASWTQSKPRNA
jgi:hypothetical protein